MLDTGHYTDVEAWCFCRFRVTDIIGVNVDAVMAFYQFRNVQCTVVWREGQASRSFQITCNHPTISCRRMEAIYVAGRQPRLRSKATLVPV